MPPQRRCASAATGSAARESDVGDDERRGAPAAAFNRRLAFAEPVFIPIDQRHGGALGGKEGGAGAPDAGRRARDDRDLAFELHAYLRVAVERAYAAIQPPSTIRFTPVR